MAVTPILIRRHRAAVHDGRPPMAVNREDLGRKLAWVQENLDSFDDSETSVELREMLAEVVTLVAHKGLDGERELLTDELNEDSAELLDRLCEALAAEHGYAWGG
jgi:hypothetical protein